MANTSQTSKKKRAPCGHFLTATCTECKNCISCHTEWKTEVPASRARVNELLLAAGKSAEREERLRQMVSNGGVQFVERGERDLALARIAILRRKLVALLGKGNDPGDDNFDMNKSAVQAILDEDDQTRVREIDDVIIEAVSDSKKPIRKKS